MMIRDSGLFFGPPCAPPIEIFLQVNRVKNNEWSIKQGSTTSGCAIWSLLIWN